MWVICVNDYGKFSSSCQSPDPRASAQIRLMTHFTYFCIKIQTLTSNSDRSQLGSADQIFCYSIAYILPNMFAETYFSSPFNAVIKDCLLPIVRHIAFCNMLALRHRPEGAFIAPVLSVSC